MFAKFATRVSREVLRWSSTAATTTTSPAAAATATNQWLKEWILPQGLCPFAAKPLEREGALRIAVTLANTEQQLLDAADAEISALMPRMIADPADVDDGGVGSGSGSGNNAADVPETTLLVLAADGFLQEYQEFVRMSWSLQERILHAGLVSELQLVLFHPDAVHDLYAMPEENDAKCYAVRSPYPTYHFLREEDIMEGIKWHPAPETIPERNAVKLRKLGGEQAR
jgi:hypothetical protein